MNPNCIGRNIVEEPVGNRTQPLAPSGAILAVTQHLQQPPRRAENQHAEQ